MEKKTKKISIKAKKPGREGYSEEKAGNAEKWNPCQW